MSIKGNWRRHGSEVVIRWYQRFFSPRFATRHRGFAAQFCRPQREKNLWHQGIVSQTLHQQKTLSSLLKLIIFGSRLLFYLYRAR